MRPELRATAKRAFALAFALAIVVAGLTYAAWYDATDSTELTPYLTASIVLAVFTGTLLFAATRGPGRAGAIGATVAATTLSLSAILAVTSSTAVVGDLLRIGVGSALMALAAVAAHFGELPARRAWERARRRIFALRRKAPSTSPS